jgi:putative transposase
VSERYEFIDAEYAGAANAGEDAPTIGQMCTWLDVSRSGLYEWRGRPASPTACRREELKLKTAALFDSFDGTYGYRRLHRELVRGGERVGAELVRKLVRELGLVPCQPRTVQGHHHPRRRAGGHPRPGAPRLHRRNARDQAGRRHHLMGQPGCRCLNLDRLAGRVHVEPLAG